MSDLEILIFGEEFFAILVFPLDYQKAAPSGIGDILRCG